ncbi:MAG: GNAT family N-acetyltransferase [Muribaculaceae bacterium]|nr:GNAT family N-acetyltransferase [Muribaculaceae bacterium]
MLTLRAIEPDDVEIMYEVESDESAWKYSDYLAPLSRELLRAYAITYDADPFRSGQLRLVIDISGTPIGIADLYDISPRHLRADSGIYILPEFRNKSLASGALECLKEYAKVRLGLHQLTATISENNTYAIRAYKKVGFCQTGTRPDWLRTPDGYESVLLFSAILS